MQHSVWGARGVRVAIVGGGVRVGIARGAQNYMFRPGIVVGAPASLFLHAR